MFRVDLRNFGHAKTGFRWATNDENRSTARGARTRDHKVKSLALYRLS